MLKAGGFLNFQKWGVLTALRTMPTSTAPVLTDDKQENVTVEDILEEQQKAIAYLKRKVELLEGKIFELEGQVHVFQTVNTLLEAKIDDQEQYSRRPCLVISGLARAGEEDVLQKVATTIGRWYCPQYSYKKYRQSTPNRTTDSFKEAVYMKHKEKQKKHVAEAA